MARINISVPDELKANMEAFGLNWSSIAKEAFEHAMHIARLKEQNMDHEAGISRLRASKKANVEIEGAIGFERGGNWALEDASFEQLLEVAGLRKWAAENTGAAPDRLFELIAEKFVCDSYVLGVKEEGDNQISEAFALGFFNGAGEVFDKV